MYISTRVEYWYSVARTYTFVQQLFYRYLLRVLILWRVISFWTETDGTRLLHVTALTAHDNNNNVGAYIMILS